jgi:hypothetical protein
MEESSGDPYSDEEAERRTREAIRRSFQIPYKPQKALIGKTPRAKAMARKRKAKGPKTP